MSEENKAVSRRVIEAFNTGNLDVVDAVIDPSHETHDPANPPDLPHGPEGVKQLIQMYRGAFPDVQITVEEQIAEGDRVVTRWSGRGTHQGDLMGIAPTGKQTTVTGITIDRLSGGKIVETWENWDTLGLLQQVGAVPEPARA